MGTRTFVGNFTEERADDLADGRFHVNDENFGVISDEEGASAAGWQDSADLHRHDIVLHTHSVCPKFEKTSPATTDTTFRTNTDGALAPRDKANNHDSNFKRHYGW